MRRELSQQPAPMFCLRLPVEFPVKAAMCLCEVCRPLAEQTPPASKYQRTDEGEASGQVAPAQPIDANVPFAAPTTPQGCMEARHNFRVLLQSGSSLYRQIPPVADRFHHHEETDRIR
jgi:hypothetical protein